MKNAVAFLMALLPLNAMGAFTNFEDLPDGALYSVGSAIESNGLSFNVVGFSDPAGLFSSARGPLPTTILGTGRAALQFVLAPTTNYISFDYGISSNGTGMIINGSATPLSDSFDFLDGSTVAGVEIALRTPTSDLFDARMTLSGNINSFTLGGIELRIDNVAIFVPEPSTAALTILTVGFIACRRL